MKRLAITGLVVVMAVLAGCSKKSGPESNYDPKVDAPPSMIAARDNPSLLADQAQISKALADRNAEPTPGPKASAPAVSPTPATGPAATGPAEAGTTRPAATSNPVPKGPGK